MNELKKIFTYPHPVLLVSAQPVENVDAEIRDILDEMTQIMKINNGIGLAAPQIGICKRLIMVDLNGHRYQLINPTIRKASGSQKNVEGCLSLPNQAFEVSRADEAVIEGVDSEENEITLSTAGLLACVFQHEIDHLNGILINMIGNDVPLEKSTQGKF